jgi:uncharacterized protein YjgD (DUF1641 family)
MAQPIPLTVPTRDPRAELRLRLEDAPEEHAEALLSAYEVLQGLHDRGVLEMLRGALGSGDQVAEIAVNVAKSPQSIRSIRNLMLLINLVGDIEPERLKNLTQAAPRVLNATGDAKPPGIWKLLTSVIWNKDLRRGLWMGVSLLEAVGRKPSAKTAGPV